MVYIPFMTEEQVPYLQAPTPYLCGMLKKHKPQNELMTADCIIDLDKNVMSLTTILPLPPEPETRYLNMALDKLIDPEFPPQRFQDPNLEREIRLAFFNYIIAIMRRVGRYETAATPDPQDVIPNHPFPFFHPLILFAC